MFYFKTDKYGDTLFVIKKILEKYPVELIQEFEKKNKIRRSHTHSAHVSRRGLEQMAECCADAAVACCRGRTCRLTDALSRPTG